MTRFSADLEAETVHIITTEELNSKHFSESQISKLSLPMILNKLNQKKPHRWM